MGSGLDVCLRLRLLLFPNLEYIGVIHSLWSLFWSSYDTLWINKHYLSDSFHHSLMLSLLPVSHNVRDIATKRQTIIITFRMITNSIHHEINILPLRAQALVTNYLTTGGIDFFGWRLSESCKGPVSEQHLWHLLILLFLVLLCPVSFTCHRLILPFSCCPRTPTSADVLMNNLSSSLSSSVTKGVVYSYYLSRLWSAGLVSLTLVFVFALCFGRLRVWNQSCAV